MKYIFNFMMMFIGYMGYAQTNTNGKENNHITTFPNGDEAITIIENSKSNILKLTSSDSYDKYKTLELSNHEAVHNKADNRRVGLMTGEDQKKGNYTVTASDDDSDASSKDSIYEPSQGS
jgi:hypothetical protein